MTRSFIAYLLGNLAVSSSSAFVLYRAYEAGEIGEGSLKGFFLMYGLIALALQFPLGFIPDRLKSNGRIFAFAGCLLSAVGVLLYVPNRVILPAIFLAAGFALVLCGGGTDSLTQNPGLTRSGIFLACGALGAAIGIKLARVEFFPAFYLVILLAFSAAMIFFFCRHGRDDFAFYLTENKEDKDPLLKSPLVALLMSAFVSFARSWAALSVTYPQSESRFAWAFPSAALFCGMIAGGILSDLLPKKYVGTLSLAACAVAFFLAPKRYLFYLCGLGFAGISVPVTLGNVARSFPKHESAAFGIFSLSVFAGELVGRLSKLDPATKIGKFAIPAVLIACAAILFLATAGEKKKENLKG